MLTGSDQNGKQSDNLLNFGVTRIIVLPVELTEPNPLVVTYAKHGKPVSLLFFRAGKQTVRRAESGCGYRIAEKANATL